MIMNTVESGNVVVREIGKLGEHVKLADVIAKINELVEAFNTKRDRGPTSTRVVTEDDARKIVLGELKNLSHTKAAEALGLSYGQVYSARKGFTFKPIYKEGVKAGVIKE
jgi:N-acetylglutamate synthase/N-acetylornithine aminotransferase